MIVPRSLGGVKSGPKSCALTISRASALRDGVKSMRSSGRKPCRSKGLGQEGMGCVEALCSPGMVDGGTGVSTMGHIGVPVTRSKTYANACLVTCTTIRCSVPSSWGRSRRTGAAGGS